MVSRAGIADFCCAIRPRAQCDYVLTNGKVQLSRQHNLFRLVIIVYKNVQIFYCSSAKMPRVDLPQ